MLRSAVPVKMHPVELKNMLKDNGHQAITIAHHVLFAQVSLNTTFKSVLLFDLLLKEHLY